MTRKPRSREIHIPTQPSIILRLPPTHAYQIYEGCRLIHRYALARGYQQKQIFMWRDTRHPSIIGHIDMVGLSAIGATQPEETTNLTEFIEGDRHLPRDAIRFLTEVSIPITERLVSSLNAYEGQGWRVLYISSGMLLARTRTTTTPDQWALPRFVDAQNDEEERDCVNINKACVTAWNTVSQKCDLSSMATTRDSRSSIEIVREQMKARRRATGAGEKSPSRVQTILQTVGDISDGDDMTGLDECTTAE